jgi:hypothetical protein
MLEDVVPIVAVAGLWIMIVAVVGISVWGGVAKRRDVNETLRRAIDAGHKLDAETLAAMERPTRSADDDLRSGITLTALALGFVGCVGLYWVGFAPGGPDAGFGFAIAAIIVGALGVGRLIAAFLRRKPKQEA